MAYDPTRPTDTGVVRGSGGDLAAIRDNFVVLYPWTASGLNAGISGGTALSGAVPVAQSTGSNPLWFVRKLSLVSGDISDVLGTGASDGQALVWSAANSRYQPGTVASSGGGGSGDSQGGWLCHITMPSGATESIANSTAQVITGMSVVRLNSGGFLLSGHGIYVPATSGYTHAKITAQLQFASSTPLSSGLRTLAVLTSGHSNQVSGNGATYYYGVSGFAQMAFQSAAVTSDGQTTTVNYVSPLLPISGGEIFMLRATQNQGSALNIAAGTGVTQGCGAFLQVQAFKLSGTTGSTAQPAGEYMAMIRGTAGTQNVTTSVVTQITGMDTTVRNVGGFAVTTSGITIPTGSGYTHAIVRGSLNFAADSTGLREIRLRQASGDTLGSPSFAGAFQRFVACPSPANTVVNESSMLFTISGGEHISLWAQHGNGSTLDVALGTLTWLQVQCFKLTSGGTG